MILNGFYINYKYCIMKKLTFLREMISIKQVQNVMNENVMFATIGSFQIKGLRLSYMSIMGGMMY